jgi:hypothetical protein
VEDVAADAVHSEAVVGEKGLDVAAEVLVDDLGDVGGEDDLEAGVADVPAHDVFGVAVKGGEGGDDAGTGGLDAGGLLGKRGVGTGDDDRGGTVSEEAAGFEMKYSI